MENGSGNAPVKDSRDPISFKEMDYVTLVNMARSESRASQAKYNAERAFVEIEKRLKPMMSQVSYRFNIPGLERSDTYQEALIALRLKAVKDYNPNRGNGSGPYPFEKFAKLCIVRHLSTKLKASYQNKKKIWINIKSLEQNRNDSSEDNLFLSDIITDDGRFQQTSRTLLESISKDEFKKTLLKKLFEDLSQLEQTVFLMYLQRKSYEQIADKIIADNKRSKKNDAEYKTKVVKSVDNTLSRIKHKGRALKDKLSSEEEGKTPSTRKNSNG